MTADVACLVLLGLRPLALQACVQRVDILLQPFNHLLCHLHSHEPYWQRHRASTKDGKRRQLWTAVARQYLLHLSIDGSCAQGSGVLFPLTFQQLLLHTPACSWCPSTTVVEHCAKSLQN
jgi:hypothetical protein